MFTFVGDFNTVNFHISEAYNNIGRNIFCNKNRNISVRPGWLSGWLGVTLVLNSISVIHR